MLNQAVPAPHAPIVARPKIRRISLADLAEVLRLGTAEFATRPSHLPLLSFLYPFIGLLLADVTVGDGLLPLFFPLTAGFALVAPVAAIAFYDASRRRERGLDTTLAQTLGLLRSPVMFAFGQIALFLVALFALWIVAAQLLYNVTLGPAAPVSLAAFARDLLTTQAGWTLIVVGIAADLVIAAVAFVTNVVSLPLLLDHEESSFATAIVTSVRCVRANPVVLTVWGLVVGALLVVGSLPLFVGLPVVLPVLGHATWHLYRKLVEA